jgi:hypothetical protein
VGFQRFSESKRAYYSECVYEFDSETVGDWETVGHGLSGLPQHLVGTRQKISTNEPTTQRTVHECKNKENHFTIVINFNISFFCSFRCANGTTKTTKTSTDDGAEVILSMSISHHVCATCMCVGLEPKNELS